MAGEFAKLFAEQGEDGMIQVTAAFAVAIEGSYAVDKSTPTADETRRRFNICAKWYRIFRSDLDWAQSRILDELPVVLRAELDGLDYTPPTGAWKPAPILYIPD